MIQSKIRTIVLISHFKIVRLRPRAPSRHRRNALTGVSVTRRGALPWPARPVGSGQHAIAVSIAGSKEFSGE